MKQFTVLSLMSAICDERELLLGHIGTYFNIGVAKIWDCAAGALALQEAGGIVCAPDGSPLRWDRRRMDWVMAANQELTNRVLWFTEHWKCKE